MSQVNFALRIILSERRLVPIQGCRVNSPFFGAYGAAQTKALKGLAANRGRACRITHVKHLKGKWTRCVNKATLNGYALGRWIGPTASNEDGLVWIFHIKNPHASVTVRHECQIPGRCDARSGTSHKFAKRSTTSKIDAIGNPPP